MEIIKGRLGKKSSLIAGMAPFTVCQDKIGDQAIAEAMLDRLVNDAHQKELNGKSVRRKRNIEA